MGRVPADVPGHRRGRLRARRRRWRTRPTPPGAASTTADLIAMSTCAQGRVALYAGRFAEGLAHLDDAMVRVISGETSPFIAGHVYCTAIEGAQEISDFGRVAEWTAALERWCDAQPGLLAFTGPVRGPPRAADAAARRVGRRAARVLPRGRALRRARHPGCHRADRRRDGRRAAAARRPRRGGRGLPASRRPRRRPAAGSGPAVARRRPGHGGARRRRAPAGRARQGPCSGAACCRRPIEVLLAVGPRRPGPTAGRGALVAGVVGRLRGALRVGRPGDGRGRARRRRRRRRAPLPAEGAPAVGAGVLAVRRRGRPPARRPVPAGARRTSRRPSASCPARATTLRQLGAVPDGRCRLVPPRPGVPARRPDRARGRGAAARRGGPEQRRRSRPSWCSARRPSRATCRTSSASCDVGSRTAAAAYAFERRLV